jgi:hypothetical protein
MSASRPPHEQHKHTETHQNDVPNHFHPHNLQLHDTNMKPPSAINPHRITDNTTNYNALNAIEYPALYGVQQRTIPKMDGFIQRVLDNVSNYAVTYPLSGADAVNSRPEGVQVQTEKGMFYAGKDQTLGSNYFLPLGKCNDESDDGCKGEPRMVYIRNIPTGSIPLLGNVTMHAVTGCDIEGISNGQGLVPGMLEDISDIVDVAGGNSSGEKCYRVRLPVGSHIYDDQMKCELDYDKINSKQTVESRHQETLRQVEANCGNPGTANRTWWYEERCSPSVNHCSKPPNMIGGDTEKRENNCVPKAKPSFSVSGASDQATPIENIFGKSITEPFHTDSGSPISPSTTIHDSRHTLVYMRLALFVTLSMMACYVIWNVYKR